MRWIKCGNKTVIVISDKNIGIFMNDTKTYITGMLDQHLLCEDRNQRLSEKEAQEFTEKLYEDNEGLLFEKYSCRLEDTYKSNYLMTGIQKK